MFNIEDKVLLFDLTNCYFESTRQTELRRFGRSKEKRSDCPIVVLAAVVNTDGMLVRTAIFSGNSADCSTMKKIMKALNPPSADGRKKIVVMDAGMFTKENIKWLKENRYDYITVRRGGCTDRYNVSDNRTVTVLDSREHPIDIQFATIEGEDDALLLIDSHAKTLKEKSMHHRSSILFEDGLEAIRNSLSKNGGTKQRDRVNERVGRLKQRCGSIHRDYEIHLEYDGNDKVSSMTWKHNEKKQTERNKSEGKYIVQTTLNGYSEQQIWEYYNIIRRIEAVFEVLKSDLDIRPIFHQTDEAVRAHFHLAILAYWIVSTVQCQLRKKGMSHTWRELIRIMSTHIVVSTRAKRKDGNETEIRQCTEPEEGLSEIYRCLNMDPVPLEKEQKICVVHFDTFQKNSPLDIRGSDGG